MKLRVHPVVGLIYRVKALSIVVTVSCTIVMVIGVISNTALLSKWCGPNVK